MKRIRESYLAASTCGNKIRLALISSEPTHFPSPAKIERDTHATWPGKKILIRAKISADSALVEM
jgi:hypothetical protein